MSYINVQYFIDIDRVRQLAKAAGLNTLGALCEKAKIHRNSITPYIKGERSPFNQVVLDIASALKVPVTDILLSHEDKSIAALQRALSTVIEEDKQAVFLFGSRARKTERKFSDIDIGITGGKLPISFSSYSRIKSELEDHLDNFPLSLNFVNLDIAPFDFVSRIEKDLIFIAGSQIVANYFLGFIDGKKTNC